MNNKMNHEMNFKYSIDVFFGQKIEFLHQLN
jgi:hypothetical protein